MVYMIHNWKVRHVASFSFSLIIGKTAKGSLTRLVAYNLEEDYVKLCFSLPPFSRRLDLIWHNRSIKKSIIYFISLKIRGGMRSIINKSCYLEFSSE